jgi:hypothetical protein
MDFTNLKPGEIAALAAFATLLSAVVAGTFALTTAAVNGWNSRRLAEASAKRAYFLEAHGELLKRLDAVIAASEALMYRAESGDAKKIRATFVQLPRIIDASRPQGGGAALGEGGIYCGVVEAAFRRLIADEKADEWEKRVLDGWRQYYTSAHLLRIQTLDLIFHGKTMKYRMFRRIVARESEALTFPLSKPTWESGWWRRDTGA